MILHITTWEAWQEARQKGVYAAPSLETDGFIHCSTLNQTVDTANLFFKGQKGLVLLCLDEKKLISECKYEGPSYGGDERQDPRMDNRFPHIYGPINTSAVVRAADFPANEKGLFELPQEVTDLSRC